MHVTLRRTIALWPRLKVRRQWDADAWVNVLIGRHELQQTLVLGAGAGGPGRPAKVHRRHLCSLVSGTPACEQSLATFPPCQIADVSV